MDPGAYESLYILLLRLHIDRHELIHFLTSTDTPSYTPPLPPRVSSFFVEMANASYPMPSTVITGYDWIISLSDEIELIWNPRTRRPMVALVYVLLRYPAIIYYVTTLVPINPVSLLVSRIPFLLL